MEQKQFLSAIEQICEEKSISKEKVIETVEAALAVAYKKDYGKKSQIVRAKFDPETGRVKMYQIKLVVDKSMLKDEIQEQEADIKEAIEELAKKESEEEQKVRFNPERHIMLEQARQKYKKIQPGEEYKTVLKPREDFGRIAAQTAKQVIIQRIREAERDAIYENFKNKEGQVVSGIIQRLEGGNVFFDLGKTTGILFIDQQIPREEYRLNQRKRLYIAEVAREVKGPLIILSRAHPKLVSRLFEFEVPEIASGVVSIKSIAREPGSRTKIAVASSRTEVDPIGACVGQRGTRVQAVINELGGEKIDIILYDEDPKKYIAQALSPGKVIEAKIINERKREAQAIVAGDQLSLTIGREGQNVRLAAKLTGWRIDIVKEGGEEKKIDKVEKTTMAEEKKKEGETAKLEEKKKEPKKKKTKKKTTTAKEKKTKKSKTQMSTSPSSL